MAVTRLKRKAKRNKTTAKVRVQTMQRLNSKPVIKAVDVEQIKEEFGKGGSKKKSAPKKAKEVKETPAAEVETKEVVAEVETKEVAAEAEVKEAPAEEKEKKKPAKKAAPKAKKSEKKEEKTDEETKEEK